MSYTPKFRKQLVSGVPTAGDDCVVRTCQMGIDYATTGALIVNVADFRKRAGRLTGGLNTDQMERGVESYDTAKETHGYADLRCVRFVNGDWQEDALPAIKNSRWLCCWVNYAWLNA